MAQVRQIAQSIADSDEASPEVYNWLIKNLSKPQLKYFVRYLQKCAREAKIKVYYAGNMTDKAKQNLNLAIEENKILNRVFSDKKIEYIKDDEAIIGGLKITMGDWVLDQSLGGLKQQVIDAVKENL